MPFNATKKILVILALAWMGPSRIGLALPLQFSEGSFLRDAQIEETLQSFAAPLLKTAGLKVSDVRFYLIASSHINAFATLGSMIFINTALILRCENAQELIAVLAHEIGHLAGHHIVRTLDALAQAQNRSMLTMILGGIVAGLAGRADVGIASLMAGSHINERLFLSYSRAQESAADQAAISFFKKLKWPLQGMVTLLEKFKNQEYITETQQDLYVRTHPLGIERYEAVERKAPDFSGFSLPSGFETAFQTIKTKIFAYTYSPSLVLDSSQPTPHLTHFAQAIGLYRLGDMAQSLNHLNNVLKDSRAGAYERELKAQILFEAGQTSQALFWIQEALKRKPQQPLLKLFAAQIMLELSTPSHLQQAIVLLESLKLSEKEEPELWRLLSIAYGKQEQKGLMSLCLAEMFLLQGDKIRAHQQADRACHFLKSETPGYQRAKDLLEEIKRL